jgi:hypothetical protein
MKSDVCDCCYCVRSVSRCSEMIFNMESPNRLAGIAFPMPERAPGMRVDPFSDIHALTVPVTTAPSFSQNAAKVAYYNT